MCMAVADCVPMGGDPADWSCNAGFCEFVGMIPPCDPASCPAAAGLMCAFVDGVDQCVIPCTPVGNECDLFGFECTGVTDMGDTICTSPPCGGALEGEPCFIQGFGQLGTCTDGLCTCTDDSECTAPDLTCTA
jgi:hypothetical protein